MFLRSLLICVRIVSSSGDNLSSGFSSSLEKKDGSTTKKAGIFFFWIQKPEAINPQCANRNKSRLLFSSAEMFNKPLWKTVWTQNRLLIFSGSTLFASILNSSVMLVNYLQTTSADDIFRCTFVLAL